MATSKTLTPTNVTIQIPAFADKPDQRVNSNCIDKEADAINALSDQIAREAVTVTKGTGISTISTVAYKSGKIVTVSGYTLIPAGTYTDSNPIFNLSQAPSYNVFFNDNKGRQMRVSGDGNAVFHSSTTLSSNEYVFYNFSYALS